MSMCIPNRSDNGGRQDMEVFDIELTDEQKELLRECKTKEERIAFIDREGLELTDEQMAKISGGR